jgi:hypothetical protein
LREEKTVASRSRVRMDSERKRQKEGKTEEEE